MKARVYKILDFLDKMCFYYVGSDNMDGILVIDKPVGCTSFDVVTQVKKVYHTQKVGHCGTLDPDASGVLIVCMNRATKILQFLQAQKKAYIATLSLGKSTDTYDASGRIIEEKAFLGVDQERVQETLASFLGDSMQRPPIYSAIKVHGKKLYEYARNEETITIEPRAIYIEDIQLLSIKDHLIEFEVHCSKGTYIRSLCVDIASQLGYPGHMCALRRIQSGMFTIDQAQSLEDILKGQGRLLSIEEALKDEAELVVEDEKIIYHGKKIKSDLDHRVLIKNKQGKALAMYGPDGQGFLKSIRGLWS